MVLKQLIRWGIGHPKKLFLLDGLGALLSAFLLGIVLVEFEHFFGIPRPTLYLLASIPCLIAAYDFYWYRSKRTNVGKSLKVLAFVNGAYCLLSIGLAFYHSGRLTYFGWGYLVVEVLIVLSLAIVELKVAEG